MATDEEMWRRLRKQQMRPWMYVVHSRVDDDAGYWSALTDKLENLGWYVVVDGGWEEDSDHWMPLFYRCNAVLFEGTPDGNHAAVEALMDCMRKTFSPVLVPAVFRDLTDVPPADVYYEGANGY